MLLDMILMLVALGVILLAASEGLVRALTLFLGFYIFTLLVGIGILVFDAMQVLTRNIAMGMGMDWQNQSAYQALLFLLLYLPIITGVIVLNHVALENTMLKKARWLDNLSGTVIGFFVALLLIALLSNAWGVLAAPPWHPDSTRAEMYVVYRSSLLRPMLLRVMQLFRRLLFPFQMSEFPQVFLPPRG